MNDQYEQVNLQSGSRYPRATPSDSSPFQIRVSPALRAGQEEEDVFDHQVSLISPSEGWFTPSLI
jgi:hypothetical protein